MVADGCYSCRMENRFNQLPPRELVAYDDQWRVAVATASELPGWLILSPRRHVLELAELTITEASTLGPWQHRLARVLQDELGTAKVYVAEFGEAPGYHLHFHVVARPPDLDSEFRGPEVFGLLGNSDGSDDGTAARDQLATRLSARMRA